MTINSGTGIGRYEIRSPIGAGGMGEVYLAFDTELDRTVAIKILPEALATDERRLQRFVQGAKAASALNHPHILTIYEIGTIGASRFIATEFIDTKSQSRFCRRRSPMTRIDCGASSRRRGRLRGSMTRRFAG